MTLALSPQILIANLMKSPEHDPSAMCMKNNTVMDQAEMFELCNSIEMKKQIKSDLDGPASLLFQVAAVLWALLTAGHDIMLLSNKFVSKPLYPLFVGAGACLCQGIAVIMLFVWAMGVCEVFVARAKEELGDCACYYDYPPLPALLALGTPFGLAFGFIAQVEMW